jgi:hypothetical protein
MSKMEIFLSVGLLLLCSLSSQTQSFQSSPTFVSRAAIGRRAQPLFMSSFAADGSEYSSKETDYEDDEVMSAADFGRDLDEDEESEVKELSPVPMSKNSGNRFVALYWDEAVDMRSRDKMDLHEKRNELNEDHVMFCRKRNLYNETFNKDSMVDILRSFPM